MNRVPPFAALFLIVSCISTASVDPSAQGRAGRLSGLVIDPTGWGIPDAEVEITNPAIKVRRRVKTDAAGRYVVTNLNGGVYKLEVRLAGFKTQVADVSIEALEIERDLQLTLGSASQIITVFGNGGVESSTPRRAVRGRDPSPPKCSEKSLAQKTGGRVVAPTKTVNVEPVFSTEAWAVGSDGMSEMTGMIGRDGRIEELKVVNATHPAFAREALAVVAMWQFSPTYLNCSPVATKFDVTVNFQRQR